MMGSGKSVVGPLVALFIESPFIDTDAEVVSRVDAPIADYWARCGEAAFREHEKAVVASVGEGPAAVIATGGGAVLDDGNVAVMRNTGRVVWLRATVATLTARLGNDPTRPLLSRGQASETLASIANSRSAAYQAAADLVIDTDDQDAEAVARRIEAWWIGS